MPESVQTEETIEARLGPNHWGWHGPNLLKMVFYDMRKRDYCPKGPVQIITKDELGNIQQKIQGMLFKHQSLVDMVLIPTELGYGVYEVDRANPGTDQAVVSYDL